MTQTHTEKTAPDTRRNRTRRQKGYKRVNLFYETAARLIANRGYLETTIDDIAEAAGVTKAAFYHYFHSKEEVVGKIILETLIGLVKHVELKVDTSASAEEQLKQFMIAHADYFEKNFYAFKVMLAHWERFSETREISVHWRERHQLALHMIVHKGKENGEFTAEDEVTVVLAILSMLNWMGRWYTPTGKKRASEFAKDYAKLLLSGLRNKAI